MLNRDSMGIIFPWSLPATSTSTSKLEFPKRFRRVKVSMHAGLVGALWDFSGTQLSPKRSAHLRAIRC